MVALLRIQISDKLYLRDPEETKLGRAILSGGIKLIDKLGFDAFTFKKLAIEIDTTEASVYRYFKSKQHLMQYVAAWYWSWLEHLIITKTTNINDPKKKLEIILKVLTEANRDDPDTSHIDESLLHKIIVTESGRVYLTKPEKGEGGKQLYKTYCNVRDIIVKTLKEIKPNYKFHLELAKTILSSVHKHILYSEHYLYDKKSKGKKADRSRILKFMNSFVFASLGVK